MYCVRFSNPGWKWGENKIYWSGTHKPWCWESPMGVNYGQTISKFATCVLRAHVALVVTSVFRNGPRGIFSRPFGPKSCFRSDTLGVSTYPSKRWDPLCGSLWICVAFKVHSVLWEITVFHVFSEALEESFQKPNQTDVRHYRRKFPRQPKKTKKKSNITLAMILIDIWSARRALVALVAPKLAHVATCISQIGIWEFSLISHRDFMLK